MIIGLSGYARSGKDTVAAFLPDHQRRAFADILREGLLRLNPSIATNINVQSAVEDYGWEKSKDLFPEIRRLLQVLGTDVGRQLIDDDVWVKAATKDIHQDQSIVFTDVRFPNEAEAIRALGGQIWRIERPGIKPVNLHPSETAMDGWDFDAYLDNSGTLEDLQAQVETALYVHRFHAASAAG